MMRIHQAVSSGSYPNGTTLALDFEVSVKSIQRDIAFMRDRLGLPLEYDSHRFGFYYTEPVASFPTLQISTGELFTLVVAEKALKQYRGTPFEKPLVSAFRKMADALPDAMSFNFADWDRSISFHTSAEPILNLDVFNRLASAAAERKQLVLSYRKPASKQIEERLVDPYHLANINGEWYLYAWCHLRHDIRTFVPARIVAAKATGKTFKRPDNFSVDKLLRDSFGVMTGKETFEVAIRFDELVADYIREKKWHPSQSLRELPNGEVELRLKLSSLAEVSRWILGWGGRAVVLRPAELAAMVRESARSILKFPDPVEKQA